MLGSWIREMPDYNIAQVDRSEYQASSQFSGIDFTSKKFFIFVLLLLLVMGFIIYHHNV